MKQHKPNIITDVTYFSMIFKKRYFSKIIISIFNLIWNSIINSKFSVSNRFSMFNSKILFQKNVYWRWHRKCYYYIKHQYFYLHQYSIFLFRSCEKITWIHGEIIHVDIVGRSVSQDIPGTDIYIGNVIEEDVDRADVKSATCTIHIRPRRAVYFCDLSFSRVLKIDDDFWRKCRLWRPVGRH